MAAFLLEDYLEKDAHQTPLQKRLLRVLIDNQWRNLTRGELFDLLYVHQEDGGPLNERSLISTVLCEIRRRLTLEYKIMARPYRLVKDLSAND